MSFGLAGALMGAGEGIQKTGAEMLKMAEEKRAEARKKREMDYASDLRMKERGARGGGGGGRGRGLGSVIDEDKPVNPKTIKEATSLLYGELGSDVFESEMDARAAVEALANTQAGRDMLSSGKTGMFAQTVQKRYMEDPDIGNWGEPVEVQEVGFEGGGTGGGSLTIEPGSGGMAAKAKPDPRKNVTTRDIANKGPGNPDNSFPIAPPGAVQALISDPSPEAQAEFSQLFGPVQLKRALAHAGK